MDKAVFVQQWQRLAAMDLNAAEHLVGMHPLPIEIICYHCQQSAEKYLKGFMALNDVEPPRVHDLRILVQLCANINPKFDEIGSLCSRLTVYGVQPRYPVNLMLEERDMQQALDDAKAIRDFVFISEMIPEE